MKIEATIRCSSSNKYRLDIPEPVYNMIKDDIRRGELYYVSEYGDLAEPMRRAELIEGVRTEKLYIENIKIA